MDTIIKKFNVNQVTVGSTAKTLKELILEADPTAPLTGVNYVTIQPEAEIRYSESSVPTTSAGIKLATDTINTFTGTTLDSIQLIAVANVLVNVEFATQGR